MTRQEELLKQKAFDRSVIARSGWRLELQGSHLPHKQAARVYFSFADRNLPRVLSDVEARFHTTSKTDQRT